MEPNSWHYLVLCISGGNALNLKTLKLVGFFGCCYFVLGFFGGFLNFFFLFVFFPSLSSGKVR